MRYVVVGGGVAGVCCVEELCRLCPDDSVVLVSAAKVLKASVPAAAYLLLFALRRPWRAPATRLRLRLSATSDSKRLANLLRQTVLQPCVCLVELDCVWDCCLPCFACRASPWSPASHAHWRSWHLWSGSWTSCPTQTSQWCMMRQWVSTLVHRCNTARYRSHRCRCLMHWHWDL